MDMNSTAFICILNVYQGPLPDQHLALSAPPSRAELNFSTAAVSDIDRFSNFTWTPTALYCSVHSPQPQVMESAE
ncbi:hypothetical protein U9M48_039170 [Paspalum notatum var. saurae]|uniref:Uncharacterized protein n=1 Tax=Paspalum notatum var. saurae TaxID=547442 RepID=A0AAQ3UIE4_PASNO